MGKYFINIFIALRLKSGDSKGGQHYLLDKYRLLHVKSLISFLFTSFQYHIANERVFEQVSNMVSKTNE